MAGIGARSERVGDQTPPVVVAEVCPQAPRGGDDSTAGADEWGVGAAVPASRGYVNHVLADKLTIISVLDMPD